MTGRYGGWSLPRLGNAPMKGWRVKSLSYSLWRELFTYFSIFKKVFLKVSIIFNLMVTRLGLWDMSPRQCWKDEIWNVIRNLRNILYINVDMLAVFRKFILESVKNEPFFLYLFYLSNSTFLLCLSEFHSSRSCIRFLFFSY